MSPSAAERIEEGVDLEAELSPEDLAKLEAAIARSDEEIARGEAVPFDVVLDDLDRILAGA